MTLTRKQVFAAAPAAALAFLALAVVGLTAVDAVSGSVAPTLPVPVASEAAPATSTRDWQELQISRNRTSFR